MSSQLPQYMCKDSQSPFKDINTAEMENLIQSQGPFDFDSRYPNFLNDPQFDNPQFHNDQRQQ